VTERDAKGYTRCDALQEAARQLLEQFRPMLDGNQAIKSVHLELKIRPDNTVHTADLAPRFETHPQAKPGIEKYDFGT